MDVLSTGERLASGGPSPLQRDLAERMLEFFSRSEIQPGDRLTEMALARQLHVSRTPVRAALAHLATLGIVENLPGRGYTLLRRPEAPPAGTSERQGLAEERLIIAIAAERIAGALSNHVSESDLVRRYGASRPIVARALASLAEAGVLVRKPGYGWMFEPMPSDGEAFEESYRFRLLVESAALLEPAFDLDLTWAADMRRRHEAAMRDEWHETASVAFFAMNAGFHEGLARASGNRFLHLAIVQQNRLRRFRNLHWTQGPERVVVSCRQHLEILDKLEEGDREIAAILMRRHLEGARSLKR
jgi:DNA-binding GntR family transcriptional regulator